MLADFFDISSFWFYVTVFVILPAVMWVVRRLCHGRTTGAVPSRHADNTVFPYNVEETIGRRPYMEDRFLVAGKLNDDPTASLYGVFDGHGGPRAAEFCVKHLTANLLTDPAFPSNPSRALTNAFLATDNGFLETARAHYPPLDDGTTAVVALVIGDMVHVANAGDSRAVLVQHRGRAVPLSDDHKPNRPDESARIRRAGGTIYFYGVWRVGGVLAVSRAIGDRILKTQGVTAEPEIRQCRITPADKFIVLASDGLWDVLSNEEVATYACQTNNPKIVARRLLKEALGRGSADNITVLVVDLQVPRQVTASPSTPVVAAAPSPAQPVPLDQQKLE